MYERHDYRRLALKVDLYDELWECRVVQPSGVNWTWSRPEAHEKTIVTLDKLGQWHYDAIFVTANVLEWSLRQGWFQVGGRAEKRWHLGYLNVRIITLGENDSPEDN